MGARPMIASLAVLSSLVVSVSCLGVERGGDMPTITAPIRSVVVALASRADTLLVGATRSYDVSVTVGGDSARSVTVYWSTTDSSVATVVSGKVTAVGEGETAIVARADASADTLELVVDTPAGEPTLRRYAEARNFEIGTAVDMESLHDDSQYRQILAAQYNSIVPENAMKFDHIHPSQSQYDFSDADELVAFARANGMVIHGHTFVWHEALPGWLTAGSFTRSQLLAILKSHITTVARRYAGEVASWDVVNEVMGGDGTLSDTFWLSGIGPEYIDSAFVWAHRADPTAKLYLNDTHAEALNTKSNAILSLVTSLRARGVPIDGVGFQGHFTLATPGISDVRANLARFASADFDVRISEMDVRIADTADASALALQAGVYRDVLDACLRVPRCTGLTTWGFTDRVSWVTSRVGYPGFGRALPFDANYAPKPAYEAMLQRLQEP